MKLVIDHLDSVTDWVVNSPSAISENDFEYYVAGLNSKSLLIKFDSSDTEKTATKVFSTSIDVADYDSLVLSVWSKNKKNQIYRKASDFVYKIKINDTDEYYLPFFETMTDVTIGIEEITEITQIVITALHEDNDYIIISEMIAEKEESSLDVLDSVKEHIDYFFNSMYGDGINIGNASGTAGNNYIDIPENPPWAERYAVILIKEGSIEETHQISDCDGERFYFASNHDGELLLNNFTSSAVVYLTFPCYKNPGQEDIRLPGVAIWGIDPDSKLSDAKLGVEVDTYSVTNDNFKERQLGQILSYTVLLDLESHNAELIMFMAKVVRRFIARESLWINGRRHYIFFAGPPIEQKPTLGIDIIPKMQYSISVDLRENIYNRVTVPKTTAINLQIFSN